MGENPAMSDPNANHAREALSKLDTLIVQDIFLTETAYLADIVFLHQLFLKKLGLLQTRIEGVQLSS